MIKAIIFDCFGVVYLDYFEKVYEHFGGDVKKDAAYLSAMFFDVSKGRKDWKQELAKRFNISPEE